MHLPITNKTKPSSHQYSLFGHPLSKVASHAYLGVKLDSKLSWAKHIKQAMTFYKILNNIIEINPPTGILIRLHNRHHFTIPRSRLNTVVYSFYPRAIRIWNTIPKEITEIKQPESFHAAIIKLPFTIPTHLKCL